MSQLTPALVQQAKELQRRLEIRRSLLAWAKCAFPETTPALHHRVLISALEDVIEKRCHRLIVMMPPGSAKSTYTSKLLPPAFLARRPKECILACSYSYDLAESFGKWCKNAVERFSLELGYALKEDSKASGAWSTDKGGDFFCAGVNSGIAGRRADLGLIDDPIGSELEASSLLFRNRLWEWYKSDFLPRLKPDAALILICNRRHEDDLVGRLLDPKINPEGYADWRVLSFPMEATENDVLGRKPGERLWPEWYTEKMVAEAKQNPSTWSKLYQQKPTPESGDFFKREWIDGGIGEDGREYKKRTYALAELPKDMPVYVVSDHTTSKARGANKSCFLAFSVDHLQNVYILSRIFWDKVTPGDAVEAMIAMVRDLKPVKWRAEKGHISDALWPLIVKRMEETGVFFPLDQVTPKKGKRDRCGSIAGRMQQGKVFFPAFASWWNEALFEMMSFTGSGDDKADDFCDCLGHIGMMLDEVYGGAKPSLPEAQPVNCDPKPFTLRTLKESADRLKRWNRAQLVER
jgi:predicted phage terminase large subunit-like protein